MKPAKGQPTRTRLATIWLIPIIALLLGAWMILDYMTSKGPLITLTIENAEGLEAGSTQIKAQSVEIGQIISIRLNADLRSAVVRARIDKSAAHALVEDTQLWVVKPRIGRSGISGLETLLSGAYIELKPGTSSTERYEFTLLDGAPIAGPDTQGTRITLESFDKLSVDNGTSIRYRGFEVGKVETVRYLPELDKVHSTAFIFAPFDELVTDQTRFWQVPGFEVNLSTAGLNVNVESLDALINGSITFGIPTGWSRGLPIEHDHAFQLYADQRTMADSQLQHTVEYVLLFDQSIGGLLSGAAVNYRGIQVGEVISAPYKALQFEALSDSGAIPVLIHFQLDRFEDDLDSHYTQQWHSKVAQWIDRGLRAQLETSNLLTGARSVELSFDDKGTDISRQLTLANRFDLQIIPTIGDELGAVAGNVNKVLEKIANLPLDPLLQNADALLLSLNQTAQQLTEASDTLDSVLTQVEQQALIPKLQRALSQLDQTLAGLDTGSPLYLQLEYSLQQLQGMLTEMGPLMQTLNQQPNALIFGAEQQPDPAIEVTP
ncbi:intermembrane transport protein PqiB [Ferrimonas pelagia]|uniref:Intermembrane transport protein PqiB n=1 Tax=Ferrimonas pelagia TaxID=1177826 RepID=A0ABP9EXC2_9GAMM